MGELYDVLTTYQVWLNRISSIKLHRLLEEWRRPTQRWLDRSSSELGRISTRKLPDGSERRYTLHWILDHVQEHKIHHRAQLNTYLRMLGITPPSI